MKTRKLSYAALAIVALTQATGCIIFTDDGPDNGVFRTTWSLTQQGAAVSCAQVGADKVAYLSTKVGTAMAFDDQFPCAKMGGDTGPLDIDGSYTISVDVLASDGRPLNPTPATLSDNFTACDSEEGDNCIVNLPNVEFAFSP
jgi:hypothetical protein